MEADKVVKIGFFGGEVAIYHILIRIPKLCSRISIRKCGKRRSSKLPETFGPNQ